MVSAYIQKLLDGRILGLRREKVNKNNIIIVTSNTEEAIDLHNHVGDIFFEWSLKRPYHQYPTDWKFYDKEWYWHFDEKGRLSGSAGHHALEHTMNRNPKSKVCVLSQFVKNTRKKKATHVQFKDSYMPISLRTMVEIGKPYEIIETRDFREMKLMIGGKHKWIDMGWLAEWDNDKKTTHENHKQL